MGSCSSQGRSHEGIDILAPRGTKVYSATEGLIADLRNNNLGGKVIWILGPQEHGIIMLILMDINVA